MGLLNERTVNGKQFTQVSRVIVESPHSSPAGATHSITFAPEEITEFTNGETQTVSEGAVTLPCSNKSASFPLVDPATGETVGTGTLAQLEILPHSIFINGQAAV